MAKKCAACLKNSLNSWLSARLARKNFLQRQVSIASVSCVPVSTASFLRWSSSDFSSVQTLRPGRNISWLRSTIELKKCMGRTCWSLHHRSNQAPAGWFRISVIWEDCSWASFSTCSWPNNDNHQQQWPWSSCQLPLSLVAAGCWYFQFQVDHDYWNLMSTLHVASLRQKELKYNLHAKKVLIWSLK